MDEFYCFSCRKWKASTCKSEYKRSTSYMCTYCFGKAAKSRQLEGSLSRLSPEQLDKGRHNSRKKSESSYRRYMADVDAEALSKNLRGG